MLFSIVFNSNAFAESYYFMNCKINNKTISNYFLDFDRNEIKVVIKRSDGAQQALIDKIKLVEKSLVTSEKIKSGKGKNYFFIYYLDANSNSVIKQNYKKSGFDLLMPDGPEEKIFCKNVKANWHEVKKKEEEEMQIKLEEDKKKEEKKALQEAKDLKRESDEKIKKQENIHEIFIPGEKWYKLSEANSSLAVGLIDDFNNKALELCSETGNFDTIDQAIEVIEMDETPMWGTKPVIKYGITGVVECK